MSVLLLRLLRLSCRRSSSTARSLAIVPAKSSASSYSGDEAGEAEAGAGGAAADGGEGAEPAAEMEADGRGAGITTAGETAEEPDADGGGFTGGRSASVEGVVPDACGGAAGGSMLEACGGCSGCDAGVFSGELGAVLVKRFA